MHLRAPNLAIFIVTTLLAIIGVWEYLGAPFSTPIPAISLSMFGLSISDIPGFLTANAFWIMFLAWVFLAIATVLPLRERAKPFSGYSKVEPKAAA